ncbi:MAG TPA: RcnB family protein [Hyphomonadaceae bacterium]|jgi:Ni/Co efflux regulator RcnB|nr:RcnB family protein [Hyphomonadaceae bacterium]
MRLIASTLLAGAIAFGSVAPAAFAEPQRRGNDREWNDRGNDRHDNRRDDRRDNRNDRNDHRRDNWNGRGWWDARDNHHSWNRGDRFDRRVYTRYATVNNYRGYNLRAPRRGEYYVRNNDTGEILLIAAATGLVLWALTN